MPHRIAQGNKTNGGETKKKEKLSNIQKKQLEQVLYLYGLNQRSPARSGKVKPNHSIAQGNTLKAHHYIAQGNGLKAHHYIAQQCKCSIQPSNVNAQYFGTSNWIAY